MFSLIKNSLFASHNQKTLNQYKKQLEQVNIEEETCKKLTNEELLQNTNLFRKKLKEGESLNTLLPKAFAAVREAAIRTLEQRHYDEQI